MSLGKVIIEVNKHLQGWINYFRLTDWPSDLRNLDAWLRRKLRCYRLKQRKRSRSIARFLMSLGVPEHSAWPLAASTKGWWRLSKSIPVHHAMNAAWFDKMGVINLSRHSRVC
ncbi:MAG: group II intron maturase-specific domain-containing protein [Alphaproteobacteria bacterium]|nr:group II intron maturase-specific domain-containing protein [Alphaproteobacteria bacterium]